LPDLYSKAICFKKKSGGKGLLFLQSGVPEKVSQEGVILSKYPGQ